MTARALFTELSPNKASSVSNSNKAKSGTISTSPRFRSVNEAQKKFSNLSNQQRPIKQEKQRPIKTGNKHVKEMQRKVHERLTPAKARKQVSSINIPLNRVNELKKRLEESKKAELEKLKSAQMNAKKRALINERVANVSDLLKDLNGGFKASTQIKKTSRGEELDLPRHRVDQMKAWLKEFEKGNKEHAAKWNTRTNSYVPVHGTRNKQLELQKGESKTRQVEIDNNDTRRVSTLTQWLDDFGKENKAHFEKGSSRPTFESYKQWARKGAPQDDLPPENEEEDDVVVENTSMLDESHFDNNDLNYSTMPVASHDQFSDAEDEDEEESQVVENTSILDETRFDNNDLNFSTMPAANTDHLVDEECDWHEDMQELMMTVDVDINKIESQDSWDKDSVISPREFDEPDNNDDEVSFQDEESIEDEHAFDASFRHVGQDADLSVDTSVEEDEEDQEKEDELHAQIIADCESGEDVIEDELSVDSEDEESDVEEEEEKEVSLTFHCDDDVSKISFMGQPVLEDESVSHQSELLGESFLKRQSIDIISSSHQGNRIADVSTMNHGQISQFTAPVQQQKKKSVLKKFMSSLNCVKHAVKPSRAAEAYTDAYEEIGKKHSWETAKQPLKTIYDSPGSKSGMGGYLPGQYMNANNNAGAAPYGQSRKVPESPAMSLASAYRRQLSPGSSLMSGFTDVEACVMKRSNDIGQHVQHLKSVFKSPVRVNEPRTRSLYRPFE